MISIKETSAISAALVSEQTPQQELPTPAGPGPDHGNNLVAMDDFHYADSPLQRRAQNAAPMPAQALPAPATPPAQSHSSNHTGLPDRLKSGVEALSGVSLDGVKVHYNSARPAQLMAHAYAQGSQIHLAPGQQAHLPHEAWHLVQQALGRVAPTAQENGVAVNDDAALEREADVMGSRAAGFIPEDDAEARAPRRSVSGDISGGTVQLVKYDKKKRASIVERLRNTFRRNRTKKASPKNRRRIFKRQQRDNYGYKNAEIAKLLGGGPASTALTLYDPAINPEINPAYSQIGLGDTKGYYRRGFGGQPFLYLDSKAYEDKMIPSNYDEIIDHFKGNDAAIALEILSAIESGESSGKDRDSQAKSLFLLLTQFIEAHSTRVPGSDKLARALLRRIALGQLTFKQAFNRKNGLFVSAWAKKGGAPQGGQVAGRSLFGFNKSSDKYDFDKLEGYLGDNLMDELLETVDGYFSDDSDDEGEDDEDVDLSGTLDQPNASLEQINAALATLGISHRLDNINQQVLLPSISEQVKKQSTKLMLQQHPDKGGDQDTFDRIYNARALLLELIAEYAKNGFIDLSQRSLDQHLQTAGLRPERVAGDGNCFYAAVLDQIAYLGGGNADPAVLRQRVAQLILDNSAYFQVFVTGNQLNRIVDDILTSRSWRNLGGDFAPQLMATVLQRRVQIIQPSGTLVIDPIGGLVLNPNNTFIAGNQPINIVYDGGGHYDSTRNARLQL
jgi:Domain of unknown function (DUF4157)